MKNETFPDNSIKTPQNVSSTLLIRATKSENGAQYWCEARLKLGDHDTSATSQPLSVTVYCKFCSDEGNELKVHSVILAKGC